MTLSFRQFNTLFGIAILSTIALQMGAWLMDFRGAGQWLLVASLWSPLIVALCIGPQARRLIRDSLKKPGFKWFLIAIVAGVALLAAEQAVMYLWRLGVATGHHFHIDTVREQVWIDNVALVLGTDPQGYLFFALNLLLSLVMSGMLTATMFIIGFEAAWRSTIYRQLGELLGMHSAPFYTGLLMSFSFMPLALTGFINPAAPWLTAFVFVPILCITSSYVMAGMAAHQSSAWPTALTLGIFISGSHTMFLLPHDATASLTAKIIVLVVAALWMRLNLKNRFEKIKQDSDEKPALPALPLNP